MEDWKFKSNAEPQGSSDSFWYDITYGGYIKPEDVLSDQRQLTVLKNSIAIVQSFEHALKEARLINEF